MDTIPSLSMISNLIFSSIDDVKDYNCCENWQEILLITSIAVSIIGCIGFLFAQLWVVSAAFVLLGVTSWVSLHTVKQGAQLTKLEDINHDLEDQTKRFKEENIELQDKIDALHQTIVDLNSSLDDLRQEIIDLNEEKQRLHDEIDRLTQGVSDLEGVNEHLQTTIGQLKEDLGDKLTHLEKIDHMLEEKTRKLSKTGKDLAKTMVEYRLERKKLSDIRGELSNEVFRLHHAISDMSSKIGDLPQIQIQLTQLIAISNGLIHSPTS
ncbi:MAG: hypothetical protein HY860_02310 [Chlamydiales bacterium]|nr:hypothetical protein [Chlamydiales bacterium]